MKKILLLLMLTATTASAQIYRGESEIFWLENNKDLSLFSKVISPSGFIRFYTTSSDEHSLYIVFLLPSFYKGYEANRGDMVIIEYIDGTQIKTKIHTTDTINQYLSLYQAQLYTLLLECPINPEDLLSKRIKNIHIELNNNGKYSIEVRKNWSKELTSIFKTEITRAIKRAIEYKDKKEAIAEQFKDEMPAHIKDYLTSELPEHTATLIHMDTVSLPMRAILSLRLTIAIDRRELSEQFLRASEGENIKSKYLKLLEIGDSIINTHSQTLNSFIERYDYPEEAKGLGEDYQRAFIQLQSYTGKDTIVLKTRIGEDKISTINFNEEVEKCRSELNDFIEYLNRRNKAVE